MNKIAQFHKVSFEQFKESWDDSFPGASEEEIKEIYDQIKLPKRATRGSAGYDFFSPVDFELKPTCNRCYGYPGCRCGRNIPD